MVHASTLDLQKSFSLIRPYGLNFYKLLMLQMIREFYPDEHVTFSVINRTPHVRLGEVIDEKELRAQLDHARTVRFAKKELIWLAGNTFYGKTQMFAPDFLGERLQPADDVRESF